MFSRKIKVKEEQYDVIKALAKMTGAKEEDLTYGFIEFGMSVFLGHEKKKLPALMKMFSENISGNKDLKKIAETLDKIWKAGGLVS